MCVCAPKARVLKYACFGFTVVWLQPQPTRVWPSPLMSSFLIVVVLLQERRGAERRTGFGAAVSSLYQEEMIRYLDISEMKSTDILTQTVSQA